MKSRIFPEANSSEKGILLNIIAFTIKFLKLSQAINNTIYYSVSLNIYFLKYRLKYKLIWGVEY